MYTARMLARAAGFTVVTVNHGTVRAQHKDGSRILEIGPDATDEDILSHARPHLVFPADLRKKRPGRRLGRKRAA